MQLSTSVAAQCSTTLTNVAEMARIELTNVLFLAMLQIEPVDWLCGGDSGNAMSVPEWGTTGVNFASFGLAMGGVALIFFVGILGYGAEKLSKTTGGGGGKAAIALGIVFLFMAAVVYTVPDFSDQAYDGASQCFALIRPAGI